MISWGGTSASTRGTLLIKPSRKNAKAFYDKVAGIIKTHLMAKQAELIDKLNPVLRGWAQYHHPVVAKEMFSKLDSLHSLAASALGAATASEEESDMVFPEVLATHGRPLRICCATVRKAIDGTWQTVRLYQLADTAITRHQKVKGDYNPFDPRWEQYGEELRAKRMLKASRTVSALTQLTISQSGNCALCGTAITRETGWHDHHIVRKVDGGSDLLSNRVLMHPVCHAKLHVRRLTVAKPAPTGVWKIEPGGGSS